MDRKYVFGKRKSCLGLERFRSKKEVIVRITETKTGAPHEFSSIPVPEQFQSLRGVGDDGLQYKKHWDSWPESQINVFTNEWSWREDSGDDFGWNPMEAVSLFNETHGRQPVALVDMNDNEVFPKGDVTRCEKHNYYSHRNANCFYCHLEST